MINTLFYFVDDPTFDYQAAINRGDISLYTVVFNTADKCIYTKNTVFSKITRVDVASLLGNISDLLPVATSTALGAIKIGFDSDDRRYGVKLDSNNRAYVEVPWTDTVAPAYDDTCLVDIIDAQRQRIDEYISLLVDTVKQCNETLLDDAQWVLRNLVAGKVGRQINDNIDEYFRQQYGVWDWVDASDHSKGKIVRTSVIEQNVDSIKAYTGMVVPLGYDGVNLTTALSRIYLDVGRDFNTGEVTTGSGLMSEVSCLDQAIISALDLKARRTDNNNLESITDLASVYYDPGKSLYSGLNERVTVAEGNIATESSLMSRVLVNDGNGNYNWSGDLLSGIVNSTLFANGIAEARSSLIAAINNKSAGITVFATQTNGTIDTGITLKADQINLSGQTNFKSAIGDYVKATVMEGVTGTFTGSVEAQQFIAGDRSGLNVTVDGDAISFNLGSDPRAWFTTRNPDGTTSQGMFLYIKNPDQSASNKIITIDFTNLTFKQAGSSGQTAIQQTNIYSSITGSYISNIFKGSIDGKYYSDSQLNTTYTTSSARYELVDSGLVLIDRNGRYEFWPVNVFVTVSFSNGDKTTGSSYYASSTISGSSKQIHGSSSRFSISDYNIYYLNGSNLENISGLWTDGSQKYIAYENSGAAGSITVCVLHAVGPQGCAIIPKPGQSEYSLSG